ncbi:MAG: hypothetical protein WAO19_04495 [Candidatus Kryptoniota bacterium]
MNRERTENEQGKKYSSTMRLRQVWRGKIPHLDSMSGSKDGLAEYEGVDKSPICHSDPDLSGEESILEQRRMDSSVALPGFAETLRAGRLLQNDIFSFPQHAQYVILKPTESFLFEWLSEQSKSESISHDCPDKMGETISLCRSRVFQAGIQVIFDTRFPIGSFGNDMGMVSVEIAASPAKARLFAMMPPWHLTTSAQEDFTWLH